MATILHISDIHFGPLHKPSAAWGLHDLIAQRRPKLLVVSGDLTQRAKPYQFAQARDYLDSLRVPMVVVPGNHDVPLYRVWERVFVPFGAYRKHFAAQLETVHSDGELFVAGVNTAYNWTTKHGRFRLDRLSAVAASAAQAVPGALKVVVAHHPMVVPERIHGERPASGTPEVARRLSAMAVDLVLSGHVHQYYLTGTHDHFPGLSRPFKILHAGTATSQRGRGPERRRNSCNWIEVTPGAVRIEHMMWDGGEFEKVREIGWDRA